MVYTQHVIRIRQPQPPLLNIKKERKKKKKKKKKKTAKKSKKVFMINILNAPTVLKIIGIYVTET